MGFWDWLSGMFGGKEEEEAPPEPLVLGAELHCPYGLTNSHLIVDYDNINVNSLPGACVLDCIPKENIMPFGHCGLGVPCEEIIDLEEKWENPEPQKTLANGEEIITTKSTIICKRMGMEITAVTSGQDGVFAMQWAAQQKKIQEFEEKYPGLMDILKDPYGSLYLDSDMYKMALRFLRDCVEKNGGELPLAVVYAPTSLEEEMMKAALVHLLPGIDSAKQESFLSVLEARSVVNNTYDAPGWDAHLLNEQMLEMLETDCAHTAELIEKEGFYRWSEEHKQSLKIVADSITDFTYSLALYYSMMANQDQVCRKNNLMEKGANKLKNALKKAFSSENKGGSKTLTTVEAEEYAFNAIKGSNNADTVVLGKYESGSAASYDAVAKDMDAQYFNLDNWDELSLQYSTEEIWEINERFLDIQTSSGREIYLSHDPTKYIGGDSYYSKEIQYLIDNGYSFVKEGDIWHAIR